MDKDLNRTRRNRNLKYGHKSKHDSTPPYTESKQVSVIPQEIHHEKASENVDVSPQFAGLKRETQEILKISETENNEFKNREVFSNWAKYEIPDDDNEISGADFRDLLNAPISVGGHFKFKSEKTWDMDYNGTFREYFSLNIKMLGDGLSSISFYERQNLKTDIFTKDDICKMEIKANRNRIKYELAVKKNIKAEDSEYLDSNTKTSVLDLPTAPIVKGIQQAVFETFNDVQDNVIVTNNEIHLVAGERKSQHQSEFNNSEPLINEKIEFTAQIEHENETGKYISKENVNKINEEVTKKTLDVVKNKCAVKILEDDDLDDLLNLKSPIEEKFEVQSAEVHEDHLLQDEPKLLSPATPIQDTKLDLEDWLDDLLN